VLAALLPFVFALLWASSYAAAKIGLLDGTPFAFVALRLGIAAVAMALLLPMLGRRLPRAARWPSLMLGGALLHGLGLPWRMPRWSRSMPRRPRWSTPSTRS
jgi:drug/metabolite transporter (DMT)-like permease